jgi:hypothetical protein
MSTVAGITRARFAATLVGRPGEHVLPRLERAPAGLAPLERARARLAPPEHARAGLPPLERPRVACARLQRPRAAFARLGGRLFVAPCDQRGQAAVELVAFLPLLLVATLGAAAVLAGQSAGERAGQAAQAGAMALIQGGDPRAAARAALPEKVRRRAAIEIDGRRVTVRVRPRMPLAPLASAMTAKATADAGPEPAP